MAMTASDARKNLFNLIDQVNDKHEPMEIISRRSAAVLMSKADYDSWVETAYLFSNPANAKRLIESMEQARQGITEAHNLIDDDDE
jgi:antitoxin YefM